MQHKALLLPLSKWFTHLVESKLDALQPAEFNHSVWRLKLPSWNSFLAMVNNLWTRSVIAFPFSLFIIPLFFSHF